MFKDSYQLALELLNLMDSSFWNAVPKKAYPELSRADKLIRGIKQNESDVKTIHEISDALINATQLYPGFHPLYTEKTQKEKESHELVCKMIDLCESFIGNDKRNYINRVRKPGYVTLNEFLPSSDGLNDDSRGD